jgi:hypothetical protein
MESQKRIRNILDSRAQYRFYNLPKGTVSRDLDGLLVVWIHRALFGDESLIVFLTFYCFSVFNFEFYFLQRYCIKDAPLYVIGVNLLQMCYRLLATL